MSRRKPAEPEIERKRCAIYTRKSTTHGLDKEFSSLDAQWEACAAYVRGQPGWELVPERHDDGGFTGASLERPAFQRLIAAVEEGRVDVVVVYKIDRLSRSLLDFASLMERFRKAGAYFVSVTQPFLSADSDAMAQLLLNVLMAFAQFERQMIAERIRDKVVASRRKGLWTGGNVPFGYTLEQRRLVPREDEAVLVRWMVALYLAERSDAVVVRELAARGVLTRAGRPWTPQSVARVLSNPVYAGYVTLGEELNEGDHAPLIDREQSERLQSLRAAARSADGARERAARQRNPEYLLRGLVYCACRHADGHVCGYALTPASTRNERRVFRYYRCLSRDKLAPGVCPGRAVSAPDLESVVRDRIAEVARELHARAAERPGGSVEVELRCRIGRDRIEAKQQRAALRDRLVKLDTEVHGLDAQLAAAAAEGRAYLEPRRDARAAERERCQAKLREVDMSLGKLDHLVLDGAWIAEQLQRFDRVWEHLLPLNRLRVVRAVVARVDVDEPSGDVAITLQPWVGQALGAQEAPDAA